MNKKKLSALLVAGTLTMGVIGGTLAWFTSNDSVTNVFNTGETTNPGDGDAGIKVNENFPNSTEGIYDNPVTPGDILTKKVWVDSEANYDQFVRATITKVWRIGDYEITGYSYDTNKKQYIYYGSEKKTDGTVNKYSLAYIKNGDTGSWVKTDGVENLGTGLDYSKIQLDFGENLGSTVNDSKWYATTTEWGTSINKSGYYYYNNILEGNAGDVVNKTSNLLEKVTFVADETQGEDNKDNVYKNLTFEVKVEAESIQATNGAANSAGWGENVPAASISGYTK